VAKKPMKWFLCTIFISFILFSCSKDKREARLTPTPPSEAEKSPETEIAKSTLPEKLESQEELEAQIGKIKTFTPDLFVKLTIIYRRENKRWLEEVQNLPPAEQDAFIENKNREFFNRFGITEEEYISYSQNNIEELNAYMSEHPELLPELMDEY